jgi:hypothetical protein
MPRRRLQPTTSSLAAERPSSSRSRGSSAVQRRKQIGRIVDKLQVVTLRRPNALDTIESVLDGMLRKRRRDDPKDGT